MYPEAFEKLIALFEKLPGVGNKTAQRYAFALLEKGKEELDYINEVVEEAKTIKRCKTCGFLSDQGECLICKDESRDKTTIMVVAYPQDVVAMEKTGSFHGVYHVLNGLISSSKGIYPDDIGIKELLSRISTDTKEIIVATSPTMDGEMTALYLNKVLKEKEVKVTRLAHGLPMGASLDYADELTLIKALDNRKSIDHE